MLKKVCCRCCSCCIFLLVLACVYSGFVWFYLKTVRSEDSALQGPFNDDGCGVVAKDLIRGGSSLAQWKGGVVIVSAGDLNTTFRHYAQGAKGTGLFAVDLEAASAPAVRRLELLDWPEGETLVGQGLFVSQASGRLYVVNHGRTHGEAVAKEQTYYPGQQVQGQCCCCSDEKFKWYEATVLENLGDGAYKVLWHHTKKTKNTTAEVVFARQMREFVHKGRLDWLVLKEGPECGGFDSKITEEDCLKADLFDEPPETGTLISILGIGQIGSPFAVFKFDEPPGCFLLDGQRHFNRNPNGHRRLGRLSFCKTSIPLGLSEVRTQPGEGKEADGPESSVEVFEILGETYENLRLRHLDTIVDDLFPYQAISQVVEGRNESELFVLRELRWRSSSHEHNFAYGSRNRDPYRDQPAAHAYWFYRWLGLSSLARLAAWVIINLHAAPGFRFRDAGNSPVHGDVNVVRCWQLAPQQLESEGIPVLGGRRWECERTEAHGLPKARGLTISPDRSDLLVGVRETTLRYHIGQNGELVEVGSPRFGNQGWVDGLSWQEDGTVLYSIQSGPTLFVQYFRDFLVGPGPPTELVVGEPPDATGWSSWLSPSPSPLPTFLRLDGSIFSGTSSWVRRGSTVLAGTDWEEGLLFCTDVKPPQMEAVQGGDRVWVREDPPLGGRYSALTVFDTPNHDRPRVQSVQNFILAHGGIWLAWLPGYWTPTWRTGTVREEENGLFRVLLDKASGRPEEARLPSDKLVRIKAASGGPLRPGEWVQARHAAGDWRFAEVLEEGIGVARLRWASEVVGDWQIRSTHTEGEVRVSFQGTDEPFGQREDGLTYGWVKGSASPDANEATEGTCDTKDEGACESLPKTTPPRLWELAVPVGFYEVLLQREGHMVNTADCFVEGRQVQGAAAVQVQVLDGRLTLGGCLDGLTQLVARPVSEEEALATTFFKGILQDSVNVGRFEDASHIDSADCFLRRLPAGLTAKNVTLLVTISGGVCGPKTVVRFEVDEKTLQYFQHGITAGHRPIYRVRELTPGRALVLPSTIWVGPFLNGVGCDGDTNCVKGWGLGNGSPERCFATRLFGGRCAGLRVRGGEIVELSYLAGPPRLSSEKPPRKALGWAELCIRRTKQASMSVIQVLLTSQNADGSYGIYNHSEKEHRLPLTRVRRLEAAGYYRKVVSQRPQVCQGYQSLATWVPTTMDCLRLCSARRRCRFAMWWESQDMYNCRLSQECKAIVDLDHLEDCPSQLYVKL